VKLRRTSSLPEVAITVGDALRRHGIRAVLTGGACASLYTGGRYSSVDADFVIIGVVTRADLDVAMASVGFRRDADRYVHPAVDYYVEFVSGPVAIGMDDTIRPATRTLGNARTLALSPTDSCRDRLAAFYHWRDRQSLDVAAQIALHNRLNWRVLREWSTREGFAAAYDEFADLVKRRRRAGRAHPRGGSPKR
jgi:hypothetical protein